MDDLKNLKKLFNECLFRIPDYQRGYSWGSQQLEEFWDDLIGMLPQQDHYTGMISLKNVSKDDIYRNSEKWINEKWLIDNGYEVYEVVDGQQRLTTIIILINEIYNYCKTNNLEKLNGVDISEIANTFLVREKDEIIRTYKFGYEVDNPSYNYFKIMILGDEDKTEIKETFYTLNLSNAKSFFFERLKDLSVEEVEEIYRKVTLHLKFNLYNINDDFNVFVAFETMNNRGKRLSYLELLKNRLIYLSTLFKDSEDAKKTVRNNINETWKEIYGYLGKNKSRPLSDDSFLSDHWTIYFGYNTRKTQGNKTIQFHDYILGRYFIQQNIGANNLSIPALSDETQEPLDTNYNDEIIDADDENEELEESVTPASDSSLTLGDISKYINSLRELIPFWYQTYEPSNIENSDISKYIFRLNALGFVNARPLAAVLLSRKDISNDIKVECLRKIERYNFLHFRLNGYNATWKNSTFYNYARDLYFDNIEIEEIINQLSKIDYLSSNNVVTNTGPIDKFERLSKRDGFYSWGTLRYFLYIYDTSKTETRAEQIDPVSYFSQDPKDYYSIEHIFPQKPTDQYWIDNFGGLSEAEKKLLTGSLGNLLPLSTRINSRLQNHSFDQKKDERYGNGSKSEVEVSKIDKWTPEAILNRGMELLSFMEKEFDFKFPHDLYRKKLLGLKFMANEEIDKNSNRTDIIVLEEECNDSGEKETYTEQQHLQGCTSTALVIYNRLRSRILELGDVVIEPKKLYLAFKHNTNICDIQPQQTQVKITINMKTGELDDPKGLAKDMETPHIGHWGNGDYELVIDNLDNIDYIMNLIEQSYKTH